MKSSNWQSFLLFIVFNTSLLFSQPWPNDPAGDPAVEQKGFMDGNRVRLQFSNSTELSDWGTGTDPYSHKWPNDNTGGRITDGIAFITAARVFVENDSIPVTDPTQIQTRTDLDTLYFCQSNFRIEQDVDPTGTIEWNMQPVRGYSNNSLPDSPPAISNDPNTWPVDGWPITDNTKIGAGHWFGRRGVDIPSADLE